MSEEIETGVSHIAYFRTDGGSPKLYTQEYVDDLQNQLQQKENIIKEVRDYTVGDLRLYDNESIEFAISNKLLEILDKENK